MEHCSPAAAVREARQQRARPHNSGFNKRRERPAAPLIYCLACVNPVHCGLGGAAQCKQTADTAILSIPSAVQHPTPVSQPEYCVV